MNAVAGQGATSGVVGLVPGQFEWLALSRFWQPMEMDIGPPRADQLFQQIMVKLEKRRRRRRVLRIAGAVSGALAVLAGLVVVGLGRS